jgi:hypothetical protein
MLIGALLLHVTELKAQNTRPMNVYGVGNSSCGAWSDARRKNSGEQVTLKAWVFGYMTAYNAWSPQADSDVLMQSDSQGIVGWIDQYCFQHPLDSLITATTRLILDELVGPAPSEKTR